MNLIRTFYPVGQGAFYTERHFFNGEEFTVVYDCGSTTLKKKKFEKKIKSTFTKDHTIDILFISHFHADHINGVEILKEHCDIKRVVIPLLDPDAKSLVKAVNMIDNNYLETELIDNPGDFFAGIPVITIGNANIDMEGAGIDLEGDRLTISEINTSTSVSSGTVFSPRKGVEWLFIPFNYKQDERKGEFVDALEKYKLKLTDIDTIKKIKKHENLIRKAYNDVTGDLNGNSMALFSGKQADNKDDINTCFHHHHQIGCCCNYMRCCRSGCLYMGDIDLTQRGIVNDLSGKLKRVFSSIGTLQIPHHGSIHNFEKSILRDTIRCAIFSYGTTNTYGHPSDKVISEVIATGNIYPRLVTEEQHSMVTQWN